MIALWLDEIKFAIRRLRKSPGATVASVAALAFSCGAAIATWSLLSAALLNPLPVEAPERLFQVEPRDPPITGHPYSVFEAIRDSSIFDGIAAGGMQLMAVSEKGNVPQNRAVYFANHDFFATLGIGIVRGRAFDENDNQRGARPVAVLSDHYWRSAFSADANVIGQTVDVSGTAATIIGVLPRGFRGLDLSQAPDLYLPLQVAGDIDYERFNRVDPFGTRMLWIHIVGRLQQNQTSEAATSRLNSITLDDGVIREAYTPLVLTNVNTAAIPESARVDMRQFATLLSITVGLLLLIGCLTVGMLLLVRTEDRSADLAVCLALGATRGRLAASIAVEAGIQCTLGAVLSVPVALWLSFGLRAFQLPGSIDIERLDLVLAPGTWLAMTATALATTFIITLLASFTAARTATGSPFQSRSGATRVTRQTSKTTLVASQVAITLVLVTGAGLFTRSLIEALSLNTGIETDQIFTTELDLAPFGYSAEQATGFVNELRERLQQSGTIRSVSISQYIGAVQEGLRIAIDGEQRELPSGLAYIAVDQNFFSTIGLPMVNRRNVARSETAGEPGVAVVSEALGKLIADGGSPIGHRISDWGSIPLIMRGEAPAYLEVISVVPNLITDINNTEPFAVYQPIPPGAPMGRRGTALFVRAAGDPDAAMRETLAAAHAIDRRVTLPPPLTLDQQITQQMGPQRFGIYVLGVLGGIALLLTMLSAYVIAESIVVSRRRELGIRAALGAGIGQLRYLLLRDTARLVGIGLIAGLVLAVFGARLVRTLLYQVQPLDALTLVTAGAIIFGLALFVSLRPAFEATRDDLTSSLRNE